MTKPLGFFGRLALAMLGPRPAQGRLATLAEPQSTALAVVPVEKSGWKFRSVSGLYLFLTLFLSLFMAGAWLSGGIFAGLIISPLLMLPFFSVPQLVLVATCKEPLLVLEAEGLRVNFTGDFFLYDQITRVRYGSSGYMPLLHFRLAPGVPLNAGRAPYRLGMFFNRQVLLFAVFEDPVTELGDEIWRRKKALGAIQPDETDPAAPTPFRWW
ncbi:MAG TPA: hypothetical protein VJS47_03680 [Rhizomicrobium sp.]|nr:hypothetical protein [Rhizomicrobium sp.]